MCVVKNNILKYVNFLLHIFRYCYNGLQRKDPNAKNGKSVSGENGDAEVPDILSQVLDFQVTYEGYRLDIILISFKDAGSNTTINTTSEEDSVDQIFTAACKVVCEWANKLLGRCFDTLIELAKFLVNGSYVSTKSMAAFIVISSTDKVIQNINQRFVC